MCVRVWMGVVGKCLGVSGCIPKLNYNRLCMQKVV